MDSVSLNARIAAKSPGMEWGEPSGHLLFICGQLAQSRNSDTAWFKFFKLSKEAEHSDFYVQSAV